MFTFEKITFQNPIKETLSEPIEYLILYEGKVLFGRYSSVMQEFHKNAFTTEVLYKGYNYAYCLKLLKDVYLPIKEKHFYEFLKSKNLIKDDIVDSLRQYNNSAMFYTKTVTQTNIKRTNAKDRIKQRRSLFLKYLSEDHRLVNSDENIEFVIEQLHDIFDDILDEAKKIELYDLRKSYKELEYAYLSKMLHDPKRIYDQKLIRRYIRMIDNVDLYDDPEESSHGYLTQDLDMQVLAKRKLRPSTIREFREVFPYLKLNVQTEYHLMLLKIFITCKFREFVDANGPLKGTREELGTSLIMKYNFMLNGKISLLNIKPVLTYVGLLVEDLVPITLDLPTLEEYYQEIRQSELRSLGLLQ